MRIIKIKNNYTNIYIYEYVNQDFSGYLKKLYQI